MKRNVTVWRVFPAKQRSREFESDDIFLDAACGLLNKEMSTNVSKQKWLIFFKMRLVRRRLWHGDGPSHPVG